MYFSVGPLSPFLEKYSKKRICLTFFYKYIFGFYISTYWPIGIFSEIMITLERAHQNV